MVDEDLRTYLATLLPTGRTIPVEKGKVSMTQPPLRVYFDRADANRDVDQGGQGGLYETWFDIEVAALDDEASPVTIAQGIKDGVGAVLGLNGFRGTMANTFVHGAFAFDQNDDYQPRVLDADEGYYVSAFRLQVIHDTA